MRDLSLFATDVHPLHPSGLRSLVVCPWRAVMSFLFPDGSDESGAAADTGSAVHVAVHTMHKGGATAACLEAMGSRVREYPKADMTDAAGLFLSYARDPRNRDAKVLLAEHPIAFRISPAAHDKTQAPIEVIGTLDQVRDDGPYGLRLWDMKTSKKDSDELLKQHTLQVAAYCVGASISLGRVVQPGGLILPRKYRADGSGPVFHHFAWSWDDVPQILEAVRNAVANIRNGSVHHLPNESCAWCPAKSPDLCLPKLRRTLEVIRG